MSNQKRTEGRTPTAVKGRPKDVRSAAPDQARHWTASALFHSNILYSSVDLHSIPSADSAAVISAYNSSGPIFTQGNSHTPWNLSSFDSNVYYSTCVANDGDGGRGRVGAGCPRDESWGAARPWSACWAVAGAGAAAAQPFEAA